MNRRSQERFVGWWRDGANSATGRCFDVGDATRSALERYRRTGDPLAGAEGAGNGSLMRLAPVALRWARDPAAARDAARLQSRTTHGAAEAVEACALLAETLAEAVSGLPRDRVLRPRKRKGDPAVDALAAGAWRGLSRDEIRSDGDAVPTLEAALWSVAGSRSFEEALLTAVNLGGDADTVGAVTGQIAGALWGARAIPERWLEPLAWHRRIERLAGALLDAGR